MLFSGALRRVELTLVSQLIDFSCLTAEVLQASDELAQALRRCRQLVASQEDDGGGGASATSSADAPGQEHPAAFCSSRS